MIFEEMAAIAKGNAATMRDRIGNTPSCPECGEQHGESDCEDTHPALIPEIPAPMTIDITPESCKTPEGAAKVNVAMKAFHESREEVARLATVLFRNDTYVMMMRSVLEAQDEQEALDHLDALSDAVETRLAAEDAFLRAVAGR